MTTDLTDEERDAVCRGEFCPKCRSTDVKHVGNNYDGIRANACYDCQNPECKYKWEGY